MSETTRLDEKITRRNERILIIEDEKLLRWSLAERLKGSGYQVSEAANAKVAFELIESEFFDAILLDYKLPDAMGLDILKFISERGDETVTIMMTAYSSVQNAVAAMKLGSYTYLTKPFDEEELLLTLEKALGNTRLKRELAHLRQSQNGNAMTDMVAASKPMQDIFAMVMKVLQFPSTTILVTGESGTGKDMLAKAIHQKSEQRDGPFMNITCTALTETLLESELFGHEKGAFTDAKTSKKGLFELADGGTIFLDEIGDMAPALQAKMLRFLQERTFKRVGGHQDIYVNCRVIAATNKNLEEMVAQGRFREDLLYRLKVLHFELPPLRERPADIKLLAQSFIEQYNRQFGKSVSGLTPEARAKLTSYRWPGNVRELKNVIERGMILGSGTMLDVNEVPFGPIDGRHTFVVAEPGSGDRYFELPEQGLKLEKLERDLIVQALERANGVKTKAGALLGLNRDQIRYRMKIYNIDFPK